MAVEGTEKCPYCGRQTMINAWCRNCGFTTLTTIELREGDSLAVKEHTYRTVVDYKRTVLALVVSGKVYHNYVGYFNVKKVKGA